MALGPISVLPEMQRQGVGRALIHAGNSRLRERGAKGIVVLGDPEYYRRFGFRRDAGLTLSGPLAAYLQVLPSPTGFLGRKSGWPRLSRSTV